VVDELHGIREKFAGASSGGNRAGLTGAGYDEVTFYFESDVFGKFTKMLKYEADGL
jgi:hypothetical protein